MQFKKLYVQFWREICGDYIVYLLREILVKVECCLYIVISNKYDNITCILSALAGQVHVVYTDMNQSLFLNIVAKRKCAALAFPWQNPRIIPGANHSEKSRTLCERFTKITKI